MASFLRMAAGVRAGLEECIGFFIIISVLEMRERSSDCTLGAGGAVAKGFTHEAFGGEECFGALGFFCFFGFRGVGASSESASFTGQSTSAP